MLVNKRFLGAWVILSAVFVLNAFAIISVLQSGRENASARSIQSSQTMSSQEDERTQHEIDEYYALVTAKAKIEDNKPQGVTHVVKSGETLSDISSTYKVSVASIVSANNLSSPDSLKIGQQLLIPGATEVKEVVITRKESTKTAAKSTAVLASRSSSTALSGAWPVKGTLTSRFGQRDGSFHKGVDLAAPTGTNVYAYADGKVVFSGWDNGGYGYLVIISHGNGIETYYGHNSKLLVSAGQQVKKGQHIAEVGSTGESTGSHLHFEIRKNGTPVNPLNYLK